MARYILVEFDNNAEAEAFVNKILGRCLERATAKKPLGYRIRGYFAKPTKFCECGHLSDSQQRQQIQRGSRFGWMIHIPCNKPRRQHSQSPRNLLDPDGTPAQMMDSFLHLSGAWDKGRAGEPIQNYPIAVREA